MRTIDLIERKKRGEAHSAAELAFLVNGFTEGGIPDYQMSAWLMAVCFQGMSDVETTDLTMAMADSGQRLDLSSIDGVKCDKHSTGGVADTTTLVLMPLVAAAGGRVAKMSGRGLGFTGGTIDKLEAVPGFRANLSVAAFEAQVRRIGLALTGQTPDIAPADGKIYALRDVTGTINSRPLIASSIMSKKIAAGADKILLDVKCGDGAFMKTVEDAIALASLMVKIGAGAGRDTMAVISRMDEPLGRNVGNSLEVAEAVAVLTGGGDSRLKELCVFLAANMLVQAGLRPSLSEATRFCLELLDTGAAADKFREFIQAQGGDPNIVSQPELLGQARNQNTIKATSSGFISAAHASLIGTASLLLGAGRERKGDRVDSRAGIEVCKRTGDTVGNGDPLAIIHFDKVAPHKLVQAESALRQAFVIGQHPPKVLPLVVATVDGAGVHLTPTT